MRSLYLAITLVLLSYSFNTLYAQDTPSVPDADKVASGYLNAVAGKSGSISGGVRQTYIYRDNPPVWWQN